MRDKIKPTNELQREFAMWGIEKVRERVEKMENPYPKDVFLPVDQETYLKIHECLKKEFNMPIDRLAGHIGRRLWEGFKERILREIREMEE